MLDNKQFGISQEDINRLSPLNKEQQGLVDQSFDIIMKSQGQKPIFQNPPTNQEVEKENAFKAYLSKQGEEKRILEDVAYNFGLKADENGIDKAKTLLMKQFPDYSQEDWKLMMRSKNRTADDFLLARKADEVANSIINIHNQPEFLNSLTGIQVMDKFIETSYPRFEAGKATPKEIALLNYLIEKSPSMDETEKMTKLQEIRNYLDKSGK